MGISSIYRSKDNRLVLGLFGGIGEKYDVNSWMVRGGYIVISMILGGIPFLLYPLAYLLPVESHLDEENLTGSQNQENEERSMKKNLEITPKGNYVTEKRISKIESILDPDEDVHYLTRGSTVDVEGSSAGTSLFGDDRSRKSGTRGWVRATFTQKRIVVKIPQWLGNDERTIPYRNITSVDLDTGLVNKRITLQTPGQTYHIEAQEPGKKECREITRFVRDKIKNAQSFSGGDKEETQLDKIEKIKELYKQGILTEEEFEKKKSELLDDV